ncbi:DUF6286 domain-containing protein [Streptomyces sp. NPDC018031]|uniref:DUF6286 domain-containing protein n=1 Tax=Streptomyces sp. NPDC018031 TaxID=3365033 RepID=UPI0037BD562E
MPAGRFWSARRLPAAVTALAVLGGAGLLLYDLAAVRAGRTAMAWRTRLADELAQRPLDDLWLRAGAGGTVLLGLWLVVLAVTPGERAVLPMARTPGGVRAGLDRRAAALTLRDRAMAVPGVRTARVVVGRRRITARTRSHFREPDQVRADLAAALAEGVEQLGLARAPRLSVQVRRAGKG